MVSIKTRKIPTGAFSTFGGAKVSPKAFKAEFMRGGLTGKGNIKRL